MKKLGHQDLHYHLPLKHQQNYYSSIIIRVIIIKKGKLPLSLGKTSLRFFSVSYHRPIRGGGLSVETLISGPLRALVIILGAGDLSTEFYDRCS